MQYRSIIDGYAIKFSLAFTALTLCLFAGISTAFPPPDRVQKPSWPDFRRVYVAQFNRTSIAHHVIAHGLFGTGERLKQASLVIISSSIVEKGISASELGKQITIAGRMPISAYNMGVGWGENPRFALEVLEPQLASCAVVIIALNSIANPISSAAIDARISSELRSTLLVIGRWLEFAWSWFADDFFAKLVLHGGQIKFVRALDQPVNTRSWETGDTVLYWSSTKGDVFLNTPEDLIGNAGAEAARSIPTQDARAYISRFVTARPDIEIFSTYLPSQNRAGLHAEDAARELSLEHLVIPAEGVQLYDGHHANAVGRSLITTRLADALKKAWASPERREGCGVQ